MVQAKNTSASDSPPASSSHKKIEKVSEFDWIVFFSGRFWIGGSPYIELEISFEDEELEATRSVAKRWYDAQPVEFRPRKFIEPGNSHLVKLTLNGEHWKIGDENILEERSQFQGRFMPKGY